MVRAAKIEHGKVVDVWEVPSLDTYGDLYTLVEAPEWVQIGASWDGTSFENPPEDPAVVAERERHAAMREIEATEKRSIRALREMVLSLVAPGSVSPLEVEEARRVLTVADEKIRRARGRIT